MHENVHDMERDRLLAGHEGREEVDDVHHGPVVTGGAPLEVPHPGREDLRETVCAVEPRVFLDLGNVVDQERAAEGVDVDPGGKQRDDERRDPARPRPHHE